MNLNNINIKEFLSKINYVKVYIVTAAIVTITIFSILIYTIIKQQQLINNALNQNTIEQRYLKDNITAIQATLITKSEFDKQVANLGMDIGVIKDDLKRTESKITSAIVATNVTPGGTYVIGGNKKPIPNTAEDPLPIPANPKNGTCENCYVDTYGHYSKISTAPLFEYSVNNKPEIPIGAVEFHPTRKDPWSVNIFPRKYNTTILLATNESGVKTAYAKTTITTTVGNSANGNEEFVYEFPKTQVKYIEQLPESKFTLWNPRILFGWSLGIKTDLTSANLNALQFNSGPSIQLFLSSYGMFKQIPKWYICGFGLQYDNNNRLYNAQFSPFAYKLFGNNSIIQNISIAPSITFDLRGNISVLGGLYLSL